MKKTALLTIDPQNDFCDPDGVLFVPGADKDMNRLSKFIKNNKNEISKIFISLDNHYLEDISHPVFWIDKDGNNPNPFTIILKEDVENGIWKTLKKDNEIRALDYLQKLNENGRYPLCIWPPHCLVNSWGAKVCSDIVDSIKDFENLEYIYKGMNTYTEQFSVVQADVPIPNDENTHLNKRLIEELESFDEILIGGEAGSHCVANSVIDISDNFLNKSSNKKLTLLVDAISPVSGFEEFQNEFIKNMKEKGVKIIECDNF